MLGDTFDRRKFVNFVMLNNCKKYYFDELEKRNIKAHILVGNHDMPYKNSNHIHSPGLLLREYSNLNVVSEPTQVTIGGLDILLIPWICDANSTLSFEMLKSSAAEVVLGHLEIQGFEMYRGQPNLLGMADSVFDRFDQV